MTLEAVQFHKKKDGKWRVTNVGFAQKNDKGGIDLILTSLPMPTGDGFAKIVIQKKQEKQQSHPADPAMQGPQDDPEIPF